MTPCTSISDESPSSSRLTHESHHFGNHSIVLHRAPKAALRAFVDRFAIGHVSFVRCERNGAPAFFFAVKLNQYPSRENSSWVGMLKVSELPKRWELGIFLNSFLVNVDHSPFGLFKFLPIGQNTRGYEDENNKSQVFHESNDEKINNQGVQNGPQFDMCKDKPKPSPNGGMAKQGRQV